MNRLQEIEFEILGEFVKVCESLKLNYYLVCGTALGAVKYGGFIPWDDDVDVGLPRGDYEIFCQKAQELLPSHLFLQNSKTDKNYPLMFSKIRDCRTTYVEKSYSEINMNHGIYIDVFPLDGYPMEKEKQDRVEKAKRRYSLALLSCLNGEFSFKLKMFVKMERLLGIHKNPDKFVSRLEKEISAYPPESSNLWCNHGNWQGKLEYAPKEQYGKGFIVKFEGLDVRVPELYDEYLTQKYGDWRAELPKEQQVGHHYYQLMDTETPFTQYMQTDSKGNIFFNVNECN